MSKSSSYNKLSIEQEQTRLKNINDYKAAKSETPKISDQIAKVILDRDSYKEISSLVTQGKKEYCADMREIQSLEVVVERDKQALVEKEQQFALLKEKLGLSDSSEQISDDLKTSMQTKSNILMTKIIGILRMKTMFSPQDLSKLLSREGLTMREEAGEEIVTVPGIGEVLSVNVGMYSGDLYIQEDGSRGKRKLENLKNSPQFKAFADNIKDCEIMSLDETYKLMNVIAKQIGVTDTITEEYINRQYEQYSDQNLPLDNPLGRILRAMYVVLGDHKFLIPISIRKNGETVIVRFVDCKGSFAWVCDYNNGFYIRPLAKIVSSPVV